VFPIIDEVGNKRRNSKFVFHTGRWPLGGDVVVVVPTVVVPMVVVPVIIVAVVVVIGVVAVIARVDVVTATWLVMRPPVVAASLASLGSTFTLKQSAVALGATRAPHGGCEKARVCPCMF
jgi:hypothetical protein